MDQPAIVYVTYIASSPEKVWEALTTPQRTREYFFGRRVESEWKPGSPVAYLMENGTVDVEGEVLECDAPRLLSISWRVPWFKESLAYPDARVTFRIDDLGGVVRLTLNQFNAPGIPEKWVEGGRTGWTIILSGLKTLLETGSPLPKFEMPTPEAA